MNSVYEKGFQHENNVSLNIRRISPRVNSKAMARYSRERAANYQACIIVHNMIHKRNE